MTNKWIPFVCRAMVIFFSCMLILSNTSHAADLYPFYVPGVEDCNSNNIILSAPLDEGLDYAGSPILRDSEKEAIATNQPTYEDAAKQADIPWQMIAAIHLKEHGLKRDNPSNGQGIYQFVNKQGGPYPAGPVNDQEFLRQTILAAEFIKSKTAGNYPENHTLSATDTNPNAVKDTFYSYNGRAYAKQAESNGFDPKTQAYEGSPYVMTKADAKRDPNVNPTTWGQIKRDHGDIEYPANNSYGAFVIYGALAGISMGCSSSGDGGTLSWPEEKSTAVTSCYGNRIHPVTGQSRFHYGIDLAGGSGTPILAAADGIVVFAGPISGYGNNFVVIEHTNGLGTSYGHMSGKSVSKGDSVKQGQQIGAEGNEGQSTGSHLHFNVFPGKYQGNDKPNINPTQNGLTIPSDVSNPNKC